MSVRLFLFVSWCGSALRVPVPGASAHVPLCVGLFVCACVGVFRGLVVCVCD